MRGQGIAFAILGLIYQIAVMVIVGLLIGYDKNFLSGNRFVYSTSIYAMIAIALILLIVGYGLMASYIYKTSLSGMAFTLLIFALTLQHYLLFSTFWYKSGLFDYTNSLGSYNVDPFYQEVTPSNLGIGRNVSETERGISVIDSIACAISVFIGLIPVIGRVGIMDVFWLSIFGSFFYEVNNGLIWRFFIFDIGYGLRIFLYGSFLGLFSAIILGKRDTTNAHYNFNSSYTIQSLSLLGVVLVWCSFIFLQTANLFTVANSLTVLYSATVNMWLALAASVLGAFAASAIAYRKIHIYDIIFSAISGAIAFSCSGDTNFNPAVPLTVGYLVGFLASLFNQKLNRFFNKQGVFFSLSLVQHFLIPSLLGGFLSAILLAIGQTSYNGSTSFNDLTGRQNTSNGALNLLGMAFSIGIGSLAGIFVGVFYRIFNRNKRQDQFNDAANFNLEQGQKHIQNANPGTA